jgi:hypothetical protein
MTCRCTVACKEHKHAKAAWNVVEALVDLLDKQRQLRPGFDPDIETMGVTIPCNSLLAAQFRKTWALIGRE